MQGGRSKRDGSESDCVGRRRFLAQLASGVGAAALCRFSRPSVAATTDRWGMRLSASSIEFSRLPIEDACQRIAALGFEAIDIWSAHAGCPHLDDVQKRLGPEGLKDLLAKHRLKLYAFSVYAGGYPRYAELLGKAGGGVAIRGSRSGNAEKGLAADMRAFLEGLKPEAELAEKHNSYLAIENHGGSLLGSLDSFKAFVDSNANPRIGIALAPYHLQAAKVSVEEIIRIAGRQILFFYAWQHSGGLGQLPGHGPTDFTPWLASLAKVGYRGYVNPFMHDEPKPDEMSAALGKSRDYLRACAGKIVGG